MTGLRRLTGLIICGCLMWAAPAAADPITELNVIAAETIFAGGRPAGAAPLLDFAMVHAAIHDAVQAYEKRFQPYAVHIRDASGSRVAAAAAAARDVLVNRFPPQTDSHSREVPPLPHESWVDRGRFGQARRRGRRDRDHRAAGR